MNEQEKNNVYQQMNTILNQIQSLMTTYEEWKNYLFNESYEISKTLENEPESKSFDSETSYQLYINRRKNRYSSIDYHSIAHDIASLLKESGIPLSSKQLFEKLTYEKYTSLTYTNLTNNILRRINSDPNINVERAYRGYWQYHLK